MGKQSYVVAEGGRAVCAAGADADVGTVLVAGSYVNVVHMGSMEGVHHADLQIRCGSKPAQSQPRAARRSHSIESAAAAGTRRAQAERLP